MKIKIIKQNDGWEMALKAVQPNTLIKKVTVEKFAPADSFQRKTMLCLAFSRAMVQVNGDAVNQKMRCFNAEHEDKDPSMVFDRVNGHFHCYGCMDAGENFDVFDTIKFAYGLLGFTACYNKAVELFVEQPEQFKYVPQSKGDMLPLPMYKTVKNPYYTPIQRDADGLEYLRSRGISKDTAVKHGVCTWEYQGCLYLVFVNDNGTVVRRLFGKTDLAKTYATTPSKWWNQKGEGGYFNLRAVEKAKANGKMVFVTESAIDALSIEELGFHAVGLNSVNRWKGFLREIDYPNLICLFDNDDIGRDKAGLIEPYGFYVAKYEEPLLTHLSAHKDVNAALIESRKHTAFELELIQSDAAFFYKQKNK